MKSILLLALGAGLFSGSHDGPTSRKPATRPVKTLASVLGRCSGNAYCSACRNCSACGHCAGGGGTCGVCASYSAPVRTYRAPARTRSSSSRSYSGGGSSRSTAPSRPKTVLVESVSYYVAATTLNLREAPSADAQVLRVLEQGDIVTVLELVDEKWARVSAASALLGDREGYVVRAYLAE
ncbi:SH3 domain-containing protein [Hymenobacter pini]|uniref:SH3 domain-containing protein n=1 Tax=Hymenobacter pini TaxID=2880879 RepID=UPI001CF0E461|nr:SH3 domain-containing protein [Hymenobacter pini]MCA8830314.1 SH3 domain-containing protein [Hymenobacter pini]